MIVPQLIPKTIPVAPAFLLDAYPGAVLGVSRHKLVSTYPNSFRISNTGLTETDIAFASNLADDAAIATAAGGALATIAKGYDQTGITGDLTRTTKASQLEVTDSVGISLGMFKANAATGGMGLFKTTTPPNTANDFIVAIAFSSTAMGAFNGRPLFMIKTSASNLFAVNGAYQSGKYLFGYQQNVENATLSVNTAEKTVAQGSLQIIVVSRIGGVVSFYGNGISLSFNGSTAWGPDTRGANGTYWNYRAVSPNIQPSSHQTFIVHTGTDLSGFNLAGYLTALNALHGIS